MIKRIKVRNFLSLKSVDLELRPRNVLIGPNMSGKSNLVDCFRFLTTMVTAGKGLRQAILDRGGFSEVLWKGGGESRFGFELDVVFSDGEDGSAGEYSYSISVLGGASDSFSVAEEKLSVSRAGKTRAVIDIASDGKGVVELKEGEQPGPVHLPDRGRSAFEYVGLVAAEPARFVEYFSNARCYYLIPARMRQTNQPTPQKFLIEDGANLSSWLMTLQTYPEEFRRIRQAALDTLPDLDELLVQPTQQATVSLGSRERYLKRAVGLARMADGELAFLALLSMIFAPVELGCPLYCIEEPENYLHPYLLETLVELLDQRQQELGARAPQIIATTHSPHLVDKLRVEDLVVVEKVEGQTRLTRPSSTEHLKKLLEELSLGELWYSGALARA